MTQELEELSFPSAAAWRRWLEENHSSSPGVWLRIAKKTSGFTNVTYDQALDEALCFGWIDGQRTRGDNGHFRQRFTPRTRRSRWSKLNTQRVERLIRAKRMHRAGMREVEAAKADGRWEAAYAGQASAAVPGDLRAALDASPSAKAFFDKLDSRNRYAIVYRIGAVTRPETRARKIAAFIADLERGRAPYLPQSR